MIVCLGWGSLIWNPDTLKIKNGWQKNGPSIAVEYIRQSQDGRLTLVIDNSCHRQPVLWAEMTFEDCDEAKENLKSREKTIDKYIGLWRRGDESPPTIPEINKWADLVGAESIIWTDLPPKFGGENFRSPSLAEAQQYLRSLNSERLALAKEYICNTPSQIQTPFRTQLEQTLAELT